MYVINQTGQLKSPTLSGMGNGYRPQCGDALRLGSQYGSFHSWIKCV